MKYNFNQFIDDLAKATGQYALCEAVKQGYKICCESRRSTNNERNFDVNEEIEYIEDRFPDNPHKFDYKSWFTLVNYRDKLPMNIAQWRYIDATRIYQNVVEYRDKVDEDLKLNGLYLARWIYDEMGLRNGPISKAAEKRLTRDIIDKLITSRLRKKRSEYGGWGTFSYSNSSLIDKGNDDVDMVTDDEGMKGIELNDDDMVTDDEGMKGIELNDSDDPEFDDIDVLNDDDEGIETIW